MLCRATNDADVRTHPVFDSKLSLEQSKEIALMSKQHKINRENIQCWIKSIKKDIKSSNYEDNYFKEFSFW